MCSCMLFPSRPVLFALTTTQRTDVCWPSVKGKFKLQKTLLPPILISLHSGYVKSSSSVGNVYCTEKCRTQLENKQARPFAKSSLASLSEVVHHALCVQKCRLLSTYLFFPPLLFNSHFITPVGGKGQVDRPTVAQVARTECEDKGGRKEERKFLTRVGRWARPPQKSQFSFLFRSFSAQETLRRIFRCRPGGQQIGRTLWGEEEKVGASQKEFLLRVIRLISSLSSEILVETEEVFCQHLRTFCAGTKKTVFLSPFPPPPVLILPWP